MFFLLEFKLCFCDRKQWDKNELGLSGDAAGRQEASQPWEPQVKVKQCLRHSGAGERKRKRALMRREVTGRGEGGVLRRGEGLSPEISSTGSGFDSSSWTAKGPVRRQELHSEFCRDQSCPNSNRPLSEASSCLAWHITHTGGFLSFEDPPGGRVNHPSRQSSHSNFGLTMRTSPHPPHPWIRL